MITENLTTLKINKLTKAQYEAALAAGTVSENELYMVPEESVDMSKVALKPTITTATLAAANWDSTAKTYSFEADYPSKSYDIEVEINGDSCTDEQLEAWIAAKPVSSLKNKINAKGDVPSMDIPIIITVTYNPKPISLISFTINGTSYQAEDGMTWEQFANSEYNSGNKVVAWTSDGYVSYGNSSGGNLINFIESGSFVISTDIIIDGGVYTSVNQPVYPPIAPELPT